MGVEKKNRLRERRRAMPVREGTFMRRRTVSKGQRGYRMDGIFELNFAGSAGQ